MQKEKQLASQGVSPKDGAALGPAREWNSLDFAQAKREVKRLQMRIAKAVEEGRYGRVKALQYLLTHSFYAKILAVKRVTTNKGKKTPGVDGVVWTSSKQKMEAVRDMDQRGYRALPLRRIYIPKKNSHKKRPLSIPTMKDRGMQELYRLALVPIAETLADPHSSGFREGRRCADAMQRIFLVLAQKTSACWIYDADVEGCFDNISSDWLMANIPIDKRMLRQWLKAGYMENGKPFPTHDGTPQGGIISPVLANMTLDGLDAVIRNAVPRAPANRKKRVHLIRYADDFVVVAPSKETIEEYIVPAVTAFLHERGLNVSKAKTRIVHVREGFDFLSQTVRKYGDKLIIRPSKAAVKTLLANVKAIIKAHQSKPTHVLIYRLNLTIRGWANYHRHVVSSEVFSYIDWRTNNMLWQWARRRHQNRPPGWLNRRYWRVLGDYAFAAIWKDDKKTRRVAQLFRASSLPIKRHIVVKSAANPYGAEWQDYFQQRLAGKTVRV